MHAEIEGFKNYLITSDGKVWSNNRGRYLKHYRGYRGTERPYVTLCKNGVQYKKFVATLVANAFVTNPRPTALKYVRYKDGNNANNSCDNLEWCRKQEGSRYAPARIK